MVKQSDTRGKKRQSSFGPSRGDSAEQDMVCGTFSLYCLQFSSDLLMVGLIIKCYIIILYASCSIF